MTSLIRRIPSVPKPAKVFPFTFSNKFKLDDLDELDIDVRRKLQKDRPGKAIDRNVYNQVLNQTFIVSGILYDRHKSVHNTHRSMTSRDFVQRIQARYPRKEVGKSKNVDRQRKTQGWNLGYPDRNLERNAEHTTTANELSFDFEEQNTIPPVRKLWGHVKFGDNNFYNRTSWKQLSNGCGEWKKRHPNTFRVSLWNRSTPLRGFLKLTGTRRFHHRGWRREISGVVNSAGFRSAIIGRNSTWIGDEMRNEMAKQAPGSVKSTFENYEAGKGASKEKIDCEPKAKKKKKNQADPEECNGKPTACKDEGVKCPSSREQVCVKEVEPVVPPTQCEQPQSDECECPEEPPQTDGRPCPPASEANEKKKKKANSDTTKKKYGFPASTTSSSSLPATCPSSARSPKQCPSARPLVTPPPAKRTPSNSLLRCRSSAPSPPCPAPSTPTTAQKCPSLPTGPVACRKPCVPCQPPSPPPSSQPPPCPPPPCPPPACPPPPCPPPKNRCGSSPCPPPPCPPPCPPPSPPPCCPPPSSPKMEALQFDPSCKALNFYMLNAPTSIRKDEVLVQVVYSGVSGNDMMMMDGKLPGKSSPIIPGQEFSGIACAVGSGVSHIKCGDCIAIDPYTACFSCRYCSRGQYGACINEGLNNAIGVHKNGGWAEFVVVQKNQVHAVPPCLGLGQAVLVQSLARIVNAMSKINIQYGSDIVIMGAGTSGCLWASVLHAQGHKNVVISDINEYKRKLIQCLDLKYCVLPPEKVGDFKADVVIDCTRSGKSIERSIRMLNTQGQLCIFSIPPPEEEMAVQPYEIAGKELTITSIITSNNCFSKAITLAENMGCRYLDYEKLGIQTFKLGQYEGALKMKKCGEINKVVFKIQNSK